MKKFENSKIIEDVVQGGVKTGITLTWFKSPKYNEKKNIIIFIMPTLTGNSESQPVNHVAEFCLKKGFQPVLYNTWLYNQDYKLTEIIDRNEDTKIAIEFLAKNHPEC